MIFCAHTRTHLMVFKHKLMKLYTLRCSRAREKAARNHFKLNFNLGLKSLCLQFERDGKFEFEAAAAADSHQF